MKELKCPQCDIHRFQVKNEIGDSVVVTINEKWEVLPVHPEESLEGFDLTMLFCLGCSWCGSPELLKNGKHKH